jgi:PAS domain S-box-containing protein
MLVRFRTRSLSLFGAAAILALGAAVPIARALNPDSPAGSFAIQGWFGEDGLPSSRVRSVRQMRDGYLWLATAGGIARFDGFRFNIWSTANEPVLASNNFYEVQEASDGALWFASAIGLYRKDRGKFTHFGSANGLASDYIRTVYFLRNETLLIGTDRGVSLMRGDHVLSLPTPWKAPTGPIRAFFECRDGSVLAGGREGLWRVDGERGVKLSGTRNFPDATYTAFTEEADGRVWIGCNRDLRCWYPDGRVEVFAAEQGLVSRSIESLHIDRDGVLWIGTGGGLFRLRKGRIEPAVYPTHIGASLIGQMCDTREGALWVSANVGVFQLRETPARAVGYAEGLDQASVVTALDTQDGAWWIGLWNGGVYRFVDGRATPVAPFSGIRGSVYYAMWEDPDGTLWIGGDAGLYRKRDNQWTNLFVAGPAPGWREQLAAHPEAELPGLAHNRVNSIASDGAGGHWVATLGALYHQTPEDRFTIVPSTLSHNIRAVYRTREGDVWATVQARGALRLHDGKWTIYRVADGMATESPRAIYEDSAGAVWFCSTAGVTRFKGEKWRVFGSKDGLADQINSVVEDERGFLWFGTTKGVLRVARTDFDDLAAGKLPRLNSQLITRRDGMPDSECVELGSPNAWMTRTGVLLFPTNSGVGVLDPRTVHRNTVPPPVQIEEISVSGAEHDPAGPLAFAPGSRDIEIHFSGASTLDPARVRFKVRLAPLDTEWVDLGGRHDIRYPRLPHGDYDFHVIACNNDDVWNDVGARLQFTVQPFFYQTRWFVGVAVLSVGGVGLGALRWRERRLRRQAEVLQAQNEELERRVADRTAALAQRSDELAKSYETLRASEYFYHSLVESLPQVIVRKDAAGVYTYANSGFAEMCGRDVSHIVGCTDFDLFARDVAERARADDVRIMATRQPLESESVVEQQGRQLYLHIKKVPLYSGKNEAIGVQILSWDMTVFRETEEQLRQTQKELIEASRLAGMAEVATGVLHNVGNVLNSVNTSASLVADAIGRLRTPSLVKVAKLLVENGDRLAEFFGTDPRAQKLPAFLTQLAEHLEHERDATLTEVKSLVASVEHIKEIVIAQQGFARVSGILETIPPAQLIEVAIGISESSLVRHQITVTRDFAAVPAVSVERPKALQILVNLLRNAKESMVESGSPDRQLAVRLRTAEDGQVEISVTDSGVGIAPENLTRVFAFGFTTKKRGHGFGLHSSALAAKELGGSLFARSEGVGRGATFVLKLPPASDAPAGASGAPSSDRAGA